MTSIQLSTELRLLISSALGVCLASDLCQPKVTGPCPSIICTGAPWQGHTGMDWVIISGVDKKLLQSGLYLSTFLQPGSSPC